MYAAQGLAIVYIENKESTKGLDILRKIRDSLNDISVYLNLGHVLCDVKQYGKAIENYELALTRYTDGKDVQILTFLGRAWTLRGISEQSLNFFKTALDYTKRAFNLTRGSKSALLFNISYIQFQIADFITKQPVQKRQPQDISDAITGLSEAIETLIQLSSDEEKHPPYPKDELRGRANLGSSTLLNRLTNALDETKEDIAEIEQRLETAKQLRERKRSRASKGTRENQCHERERGRIGQTKSSPTRTSAQWAEESRIDVTANEEEENDDKLFEQELEGEAKKKVKVQRAKVKVNQRRAKVLKRLFQIAKTRKKKLTFLMLINQNRMVRDNGYPMRRMTRTKINQCQMAPRERKRNICRMSLSRTVMRNWRMTIFSVMTKRAKMMMRMVTKTVMRWVKKTVITNREDFTKLVVVLIYIISQHNT